jgi:hypothetical protein
MKNPKRIILIIAAAVSMLIILVVSLHSLEEIHYLKSFYPRSFTVEEAFYASGVELIKVLIISIPFIIVIFAALCLLKRTDKKD